MDRTLELDNIFLSIGSQVLFSELSCGVSGGEVLSVMGPSGCGKSSLLNIICGTLDSAFYYQGRVLLDDQPLDALPPHRRRVGLQFQDHLLFPHMTVGENLAFGLPRQFNKAEKLQKVEQALENCGLTGVADYQPSALSGGQRARISLMRTLLSEPKVLLLDEPFSKLDRALREQFRTFVFQQVNRLKIPALMVTHDAQDIEDKSRVIYLKAHSA
ncbi:MAG: ATP-binding cassette domain-containing protein [Endozoicomonas sp.]